MDHHADDNRWDYDCPQFVDFTVPMPFNDGADQLFGMTKGYLTAVPFTSLVFYHYQDYVILLDCSHTILPVSFQQYSA